MDKENKELLERYEHHEKKSLDFRQALRRKVLEMLDEMGFRPASVEVELTQKDDRFANHLGEVIKIEIQSKRVGREEIKHMEGWPVGRLSIRE